jgi:hypothetical protein
MADAPRAASPADLVRLLNGFIMSQVLHTMAELGIADLIADGIVSSQSLAEATATHPRALYRLLRAATLTGVLVEDNAGAFSLTALGQFLRADHPQSVRGWAIYTGDPMFWGTWQHLRHSIATGEPAFRHLHGVDLWEYNALHPEAGAVFDAAMTSRSLEQAEAVVSAYDFTGVRSVVDVAGGQGAVLAKILTANSEARGILFDQAHVVAAAEPVLRAAGVADRCALVVGSFFESVPEGGDVYVLKWIIHDWADEPARQILRSCRRAMAPDARLLLAERVVAPPNVPDPAKLSDLMMLILAGGQERTADEFAALYEAAGFRLTRIIPTRSELSLIEGIPS